MNQFYLERLQEIAGAAKSIEVAVGAIIGFEMGGEFVMHTNSSHAPPQQTWNHKDLTQQLLSSGEEKDSTVILKFTTKEISKLPNDVRKQIKINGQILYARRRKRGKSSYTYELRYRRQKYNISVSASTIEALKVRFTEKLTLIDNEKSHAQIIPSVPTNFRLFWEYYCETYRKRKVAPKTLENDGYRIKHAMAVWGEMEVTEISSAACREFLDRIAETSTKNSKELYSLLNGLFKAAISHKIIADNPLAIVISVEHESEHGIALTRKEERLLLEGTAGTRYQLLFALVLYTGLRPCEYKTARIEGNFIVAVNSKRKSKKVEYKKIPISPMLTPFLTGVTEFKFPRIEYMRDKFNSILGEEHILYDLRTTFYTHCEECGVEPAARDEFVGHSRGALNKTYSDLSDEYLLSEGKKLVW